MSDDDKKQSDELSEEELKQVDGGAERDVEITKNTMSDATSDDDFPSGGLLSSSVPKITLRP